VAILIAIIVVFAGIIYLATVTPNQHLSIQMGIVGPNGLTNDLPTSGVPGGNLTVEVTVGNNATAQPLYLVVQSVLNNTVPTSYSTIPWMLPLDLGANTTTKPDSFGLLAQATATEKVVFAFAVSGTYIVHFLLESQSGKILREDSLSTTIIPAG
jgi:uncharacterized membrane protein